MRRRFVARAILLLAVAAIAGMGWHAVPMRAVAAAIGDTSDPAPEHGCAACPADDNGSIEPSLCAQSCATPCPMLAPAGAVLYVGDLVIFDRPQDAASASVAHEPDPPPPRLRAA